MPIRRSPLNRLMRLVIIMVGAQENIANLCGKDFYFPAEDDSLSRTIVFSAESTVSSAG